MRVLGECDCSSLLPESVGEEAVVHFFGQGVGVAEREVGFMGRAFGALLVEDLAHLGGLVFAPFSDWGAPADGGVLDFDFRGASPGDEGAEVGL